MSQKLKEFNSLRVNEVRPAFEKLLSPVYKELFILDSMNIQLVNTRAIISVKESAWF